MAVWDDDANVHLGRCARHLEPTPQERRPPLIEAGRGLSGAARAARGTGLRYGPPHMTSAALMSGASAGEPDGSSGYLCRGGAADTQAPRAARRGARGARATARRACVRPIAGAGVRASPRADREPVTDTRQDRALPFPVRRAGGRVSQALVECREGEGRLRAGLRQRVAARRVPQAPGAVRGLFQPGVRADHRRSRGGTSWRAPHPGRLSDAGRRRLPVRRARAQRRLALYRSPRPRT